MNACVSSATRGLAALFQGPQQVQTAAWFAKQISFPMEVVQYAKTKNVHRDRFLKARVLLLNPKIARNVNAATNP